MFEKTSAGPQWDVKVEGDKDLFLTNDELIIIFGHKRPAIRFTHKGMSTICPKCGGEVRYGIKDKVPSWWCDECGHQRISIVRDIAHDFASQ